MGKCADWRAIHGHMLSGFTHRAGPHQAWDAFVTCYLSAQTCQTPKVMVKQDISEYHTHHIGSLDPQESSWRQAEQLFPSWWA